MDDVDLMPALRQLVRQLLHEDAISTEMIRRIESRDHAEAKRSIHDLLADCAAIGFSGDNRFDGVLDELCHGSRQGAYFPHAHDYCKER